MTILCVRLHEQRKRVQTARLTAVTMPHVAGFLARECKFRRLFVILKCLFSISAMHGLRTDYKISVCASAPACVRTGGFCA